MHIVTSLAHTIYISAWSKTERDRARGINKHDKVWPSILKRRVQTLVMC